MNDLIRIISLAKCIHENNQLLYCFYFQILPKLNDVEVAQLQYIIEQNLLHVEDLSKVLERNIENV